MPVTNSAVAADRVQHDGNRRIVEHHTDHLGRVHELRYRLPGQANARARLVQNAAMILAQLETEEQNEMVQAIATGQITGVAPTLHFIDTTQLWTAALDYMQRPEATIYERLNSLPLAQHLLATYNDGQLKGMFKWSNAYLAYWKTHVTDLEAAQPVVTQDGVRFNG